MNDEYKYILVVDDSPDTREVLRRNLESRGFSVFTAGNVAQAVEALEKQHISLVISDVKMPGQTGFDLLRHVKENYKHTEVLLITGFPQLEDAVRAVKTGADEYLVKPFTNDELFEAVDNALDKLRIRSKTLKTEAPVHHGLIGESEAMQEVFKAVTKAAATSATVLIYGESGTGKEIVARAIHYGSSRASAPFVPVNCGSIPEQLIESELFGHVKGAFTGATASRAGFFQTAEKGTIFLDEIGDAGLAMQVKLLRVLQEKEVYMVGSSKPRTVDVRITAASNRDLSALIEKGAFREDLYYRLNVFSINIPPLRKRGEDIILLINHFIKKSSREFGKQPPRISDEALQVLTRYHWPGNVRELENVVQRITAMTDGDIIEVPDLPSLMRFSALRSGDLTRSLEEVEAQYIQDVMAHENGNKTNAAKILGIDRKTLREKLKKIQAKNSQ